MTEHIANLKKAIETAHGCRAIHIDSEPVIDLFNGQIAWEGIVETFELRGHPEARRCYAWAYRENGQPQHTIVLESPPVDSPESAVKMAIENKAKAQR